MTSPTTQKILTNEIAGTRTRCAEGEGAWIGRTARPRRSLEQIAPQGNQQNHHLPAPVNATAPRCSMRVTAVLHDSGLLAQPNALLRPSLSRGLVRGLGQQEVLDSRQNVHDFALGRR